MRVPLLVHLLPDLGVRDLEIITAPVAFDLLHHNWQQPECNLNFRRSDHQHYCTNQHHQLAHSTHMCILNYHENTNLTDTIAVSATSMLHIRYLVKLVLQNSKLASSCTSSLT